MNSTTAESEPQRTCYYPEGIPERPPGMEVWCCGSVWYLRLPRMSDTLVLRERELGPGEARLITGKLMAMYWRGAGDDCEKDERKKCRDNAAKCDEWAAL